MRVTLTAVGPDHWGLADPILQYLASVGATLAEVQMYDHGAEGVFALLARFKWPGTPPTLADLRGRMAEIGRQRGLSIRAWAPASTTGRPAWPSAPPTGPSRRPRCSRPSATAACGPRPWPSSATAPIAWP